MMTHAYGVHLAAGTFFLFHLRLVIETLEGVPGDRKCYRMIGGVLVERTVKEVAPALISNRDKMSKLIETLDAQVSDKGKEINAYMEKHNIQVKGATNKKSTEDETKDDKKASSGVLVSANESKS